MSTPTEFDRELDIIFKDYRSKAGWSSVSSTNPDNTRDEATLREAIKQAFNMYVIGEDIKFEWKPYDEVNPIPEEWKLDEVYEPMTFLVCTACNSMKDDPECPHQCEINNERNAKQRQSLYGTDHDMKVLNEFGRKKFGGKS